MSKVMLVAEVFLWHDRIKNPQRCITHSLGDADLDCGFVMSKSHAGVCGLPTCACSTGKAFESCNGILPDRNVSSRVQNKKHTWYISRKSHETAHTRLNTSSACHPMAHPNRPAKHGYCHHEPWQVSQHHKFLGASNIFRSFVEYLNLSSLHFLSFPASSLAPSSCEGINEQNWSNEWKLWTSVNGKTCANASIPMSSERSSWPLPPTAWRKLIQLMHLRYGIARQRMMRIWVQGCIVYLSTWFAWSGSCGFSPRLLLKTCAFPLRF